MNVKFLLAACLLGLAFTPLCAQTFRPLAGYDQLSGPRSKVGAVTEKMADCNNFSTDGFTLVDPGESLVLSINLDTTGLGPGFTRYVCEGCTEASGGTASYDNDTLRYGADAGAELAIDTLTFSLCNAAGQCSVSETVVILVRRAGREVALPAITIAARETISVEVPAGDLPGGTTCRTLEGCNESYGGRSQTFAFVRRNDLNDNRFTYTASGYGGTDEVCVTICNDFGICDTYRQAVNINVATLELPFFDDFAYDGARPDRALWQDEDVLINRNFAQEPPSIGVATFDGVDFAGQAYPTGGGGRITVVRDYLTSAPLNLAGNANDLVLNFFLQPRGFGNRPETQDSFLVQFRTQEGRWRNVFSRAGLRTTVGGGEPVSFTEAFIPVDDTYRYDGFQFRFASRSSEQGAVDMWHLDYVNLDENRANNDLAIAERPPSLLQAPFTSIPVRHLQAAGQSLITDNLSVTIKNLSTLEKTVESGSDVFVDNGRPNSPLLLPRLGFTTVFPNFAGSTNAIAGGQRATASAALTSIEDEAVGNLLDFLFNSLPADAVQDLSLNYELNVNPVEAGRRLDNHVAERTTRLDNYMAYDDGTAELVLEGQEGTTILQRYRAFVSDEVQGIQLRIPRAIAPLGNQVLRLVVYTGEEQPETLIYSEDFDIVYVEDQVGSMDSLQGYTTYIFDEPVSLAEGDFYVGWQQQRANRDIGVGYDLNTPPPVGEGYQWFNTGNGWQQLTGTLTGAIMLRPLLTGFEGFATSTNEISSVDGLVGVYPNPTNGLLHLRPRHQNVRSLRYQLLGVNGAVIAAGPVTETIDLAPLSAGIYVLRVTDGNVTSQHKVVRR